jgi:hypothetical protein
LIILTIRKISFFDDLNEEQVKEAIRVNKVSRATKLRRQRKRVKPQTLHYEVGLPDNLVTDDYIGLSEEERVAKVIEAQKADDFCRKLHMHLTHPEDPITEYRTPYDSYISHNFENFFVDERGILFKRAQVRNADDQVVIPRSHILTIMNRFHDDGPHLTKTRMQKEIPLRYYWWNMNKDIARIVDRCFPCATKNGQGTVAWSADGLVRTGPGTGRPSPHGSGAYV